MSKNYFEIIRSGVNTTFQDRGRSNLYHIGIPFSGAMDSRNFYLSNKLVKTPAKRPDNKATISLNIKIGAPNIP